MGKGPKNYWMYDSREQKHLCDALDTSSLSVHIWMQILCANVGCKSCLQPWPEPRVPDVLWRQGKLTQICYAARIFWLSGADRGGSLLLHQFATSPCSPGKFGKQLLEPLLLKLHHFPRQVLSVHACLGTGNGLPLSLLTWVIPALGQAN